MAGKIDGAGLCSEKMDEDFCHLFILQFIYNSVSSPLFFDFYAIFISVFIGNYDK